MKTITLEQTFELLNNCTAVIVDDTVIYPSVDALTGDPENEFLYLSWEIDGLTFEAKCKEENNQSATFHNSVLTLEDDEGEPLKITLLVPMAG